MANQAAASKRHKGSSGGTFVKGDTLHFDTATDAPVVPAKRKQAATTTRSHATRQASQHLPSSTAHLPTRPAAPAGDSSAAAGSGDVGWKLLQKAGWKPGTGLGKNEHGDTEPIAPRTQLHTHGVGFSKKPLFSQDIGTAGSVPKSSKGDADGKAGDARGKPQLIGPVQGPGRKAVELPPEVKTAAERQQAEDRKLKAIHAALRREFSAPTTADGGDTNPLTRHNKLTATNPLLNDDDDGFG